NLANNGDCSLREAIQAANTDSAVDACVAGSGADIIQLSADTYTLSVDGADEDQNQSGDLDIFGDLTIAGADLSSTKIEAGSIDRVFHTHAGPSVPLRGMSIVHGASSAGGGLYVDQASLSLNRVSVTQNTAVGDGGGILHSGGVLSIDR